MLHPHITFLARFLLFCSFFVIILGVSKLEALGNSKEIREKDINFSDFTLPPVSGKKPDSIIVLFHGYGDTGENFLSVGALLGQFLPATLFVALDGPIACKTIPSGKQWLSAPRNDRPQLLKEINNLALSLNQYLDNLLKIYNIPPEKMVLVGFSQGARIALHSGLRRLKCGGIVALSGSYLDDPTAVSLSRPPILIIHGLEDQKAPVSLARETYKQLDELKMPVTLFLLPGVGHDIDPQELRIVGQFLKDCLCGKIVDRR